MKNLFLRKTACLLLPAVFAVLLVFVFKSVVAQENADTKPAEDEKPNVEMLECKVKVVDPDGFPVEDATVVCTGFRSEENPRAAWIWLESAFGKRPEVKTNAEGVAVIPFPRMISDKETTGRISLAARHSGFVNYHEYHSVDAPDEIVLERGFRIALTAKHANGKKLTENLDVVASFAGGGEWKLKNNGTLVSGVMRKQNGFLRVVCFNKDKPTLFSDEIEINPGDKSRVLLKSIELSPGCRIEGTVDASVARPIKNGYVIACICKQDPKLRNSRWRWNDETPIDAEGNFVFESLPKGEVIQMVPICDGFVPGKQKFEDVLAALPVTDPGEVKRLVKSFVTTPYVIKSNSSVLEVNLAMNQASVVAVTVVDQDGKPLENVGVNVNPNQYFFQGGSNILGDSHPTRTYLELRKAGEDTRAYRKSRAFPYFQKTNEKGIAYLKNMPKGPHEIGVYEDDWEAYEKQIQVRENALQVTIELSPKASPLEE